MAVMSKEDLRWLMAERTKLGCDGLDEMWEGTLHLVNAPKRVHNRLTSRLLAELRPYALARGLEILTETAIFGDDEETSWRIPDLVVFSEAESSETGIVGRAALAIEVYSPGDESFAKLYFYAARGVGQVLIIDPVAEKVIHDSVVGTISGFAETTEIETSQISCLGVRLTTVDGHLTVVEG